jgi:hypothetical protein
MAINRDAAEWFYRPDRFDEVEYGILKATDEWLVLKRTQLDFGKPDVEVIARAESRQAAIGFLKLMKES